jgi:DNA-binding MarR family transcriptional regulator
MTKPRKREIDLVDELVHDWRRERPDINVDAMEVVGRIIHLGGLLELQANAVLKPFKLRYTDFDVLATLRRRGPPYKLTPTVLRRSILISSGAMTACLDRLEKAGYLARERDPEDRRGTVIRLAAKGRVLIDKAVPSRFKIAFDAVGGLTNTEFSQLAKLLRKLSLTIP